MLSYTCLLGYEMKPSIPYPRNAQGLRSEHNGKKRKGFLIGLEILPSALKWHSELVGTQNVLIQDLVLGQILSPLQQRPSHSLCIFPAIPLAASIIYFPPETLHCICPRGKQFQVLWGLVILYMLWFWAVYFTFIFFLFYWIYWVTLVHKIIYLKCTILKSLYIL